MWKIKSSSKRECDEKENKGLIIIQIDWASGGSAKVYKGKQGTHASIDNCLVVKNGQVVIEPLVALSDFDAAYFIFLPYLNTLMLLFEEDVVFKDQR